MFTLSQHNIFEQLKALNFNPAVQEETDQIFFVHRQDRREFPVFYRILHDGALLQILAFIPANFTDETRSDIARFLHMMNKELDVPGFCIDENSKTIFYRLMVPTYTKQIAPELLDGLTKTTLSVCTSFSAAIEAMAAGSLSLEEVIKKSDELKTKEVR